MEVFCNAVYYYIFTLTHSISEYNLQIQHIARGYESETREHVLLPKERSLYTTIVRHPATRFVSAFIYFGHYERMKKGHGGNLTLDNAINLFLDNPKEYKGSLHRPSWMLGLRRRFPNVTLRGDVRTDGDGLEEQTEQFVQYLNNEFDLVMITERIDESLVVLKEMMGWTVEDILYRKRMVAKTGAVVNSTTRERILRYDYTDLVIYKHFNTKLEMHIDRIGRVRFEQMVKEFTALREEFDKDCTDGTDGPDNDNSSNQSLECHFLSRPDVGISKMITSLQMSDDFTNFTR